MLNLRWSILLLLFFSITLSTCFTETSVNLQDMGTFVKFLGNSGNTEAYAVTEISTGFMIVGTTRLPTSRRQLYLAKIDESGALIGEFTSNDSINRQFFGVDLPNNASLEGRDILAVGGEVFVLGLLSGFDDSGNELGRLVLIKISEDANFDVSSFTPSLINSERTVIVNNRNIYFGGNNLPDIIPSVQDLVILANQKEVASADTTNMYIARWEIASDQRIQENIFGILGKRDDVGNLFVQNQALVWCGTSRRIEGDSDLRVIKFNLDRGLEWIYDSFLSNTMDQGQDIIRYENNFLVLGSTTSLEGDADLLLMELDENGNLISSLIQRLEFEGNSGGNDRGLALTQGNDGSIIITGVSDVRGNPDIFLLKMIRNGTTWQIDENFPLQFLGNASSCTSEISMIPEDQGVQILALADGYLILTTVCFDNNSIIGLFKTNLNGEIFGVTSGS